ncbi:hypothetical protein A1F94_012725 [Pyrenophora tritici-repentis]|uniref:Uncharacterized protein n=1 Tax=Pyrenophora tritici-repentis TaxID=45151 RepID=A0A2W1DDZ4_9PLEO|nr:hypothetical protein PtrV1_09361 [Pyrenophora tritici-repentis]KAF7568335.1 hypothetical protein PtrM4_129480 [Pyrenophora tritici-repentis]KAG9377125.1 hypothetical protein A1F94_012725 [Pyrenophora tritici-repentis]KAI0571218.1 hypothetical protein Alg215_10540 [Pyrenophora tritici-repentis]KAI0572925.1 hypothetical protein Alg130_10303 [Pyrenophora tritici-repentis]
MANPDSPHPKVSREPSPAHRASQRQETPETSKPITLTALRKAKAAAKPAKCTRAGPTPPHYSDSEPDDEEDFNPYRRSRSPARRARPRSRSAEDDRRRPRPKKPEPEVFSSKDTSHVDYLK